MKHLAVVLVSIMIAGCGSPSQPPAYRPSPELNSKSSPKVLAKELPGLLRSGLSKGPAKCSELVAVINHKVTWDNNPALKEPTYHKASVEGTIRCRNHHTQLADDWQMHKPVEDRYRATWQETVKRTFIISVVADDNHFITDQGPYIDN